MLRRSLIVLAKQGEKRTVVRDPRKRAVPAIRADESEIQQQQSSRPLMPFEPTQQNQQAVGSSLGSYVLMGAGVAVGFAIVGALFG
jgi:preprotein translocase subunit SecF